MTEVLRGLGLPKYLPSPGAFVAPARLKRDVVIIGGGHNGLVASAYLAKAGLDTLVLERRHCIGGAAITEEIVPGFKFSRASYLAGLLRPKIIQELELEKFGFKYLPRDPSSFTPTKLDSEFAGKSLLLGSDNSLNCQSIAQFSKRDAEKYLEYELFLAKIRDIIDPLLDSHPPALNIFNNEIGFYEKLHSIRVWRDVLVNVIKHANVLPDVYEFMTAPAEQILNRWFEGEVLKTTLATDSVVGALVSPKQCGSAYVLLHHVMGEAAGRKGVWAYVEGGMGKISEAIATSARRHGSEIVTNATVREIKRDDVTGRAVGVIMEDGTVIEANVVISGCTPYHTFVELLPDRDCNKNSLQPPAKELDDYIHRIRHAVDRLPNFTCLPSPSDGSPGPMHMGTIHFESHMHEIDQAYREAASGRPATRPVIEMTIPSALDSTIAPSGKHVVQLFVQFAPYEIDPTIGHWGDPVFKNAFADQCFRIVDEYCPGFSASVVGRDVLSPLDLEKIFGLHRGSISHGAIGIHQIGYARPIPGYSSHRTPIDKLYLCSAGNHPGGGVMGAAGKNCARIVLSDMNKPLS